MEWVTSTTLLGELKSSRNSDAWGLLYKHFYPALVRLAHKVGLPEQLSEDAAHEALQAFYVALTAGKYTKERGRLHSWLFGIAHRVMLNMRRRIPRDSAAMSQQAGTGLLDQMADERTVEDSLEAEWKRFVSDLCIRRVRHEISARDFHVFELYVIRETPSSEVADIMGISRSAVYTICSRILKRMREIRADIETSI